MGKLRHISCGELIFPAKMFFYYIFITLLRALAPRGNSCYNACRAVFARREGNMMEVVAALIFQEGKFLICKRPAGKARAHLWEFVGGKVERGETPEEALNRECREELGICVRVLEKFMDVTHAYPDLTVHLTLYLAEIAAGKIQLLEHEDARFIAPSEINNFDFCPADKDILIEISRRFS